MSKKEEKKINLLFFSNNIIGGDNITFSYRHRKEIIIGLLISFVIVTILFLTLYYYKENKPDHIKEEKTILKKKTTKEKEEIEEYKVDIKGEVNSPGIYTLNSDNRVIDVIEKAGGLTENANTSVINLSKKIMDEMVIIIYSNLEVKEFEKTKEKEKYLQEKCVQKDENSLKNDACISNNKDTNINSKININTASLEELQTLNGIGESKAKDIIAYREKNRFNTIEDIKNVPGIGDGLFAKIKENITV